MIRTINLTLMIALSLIAATPCGIAQTVNDCAKELEPLIKKVDAQIKISLDRSIQYRCHADNAPEALNLLEKYVPELIGLAITKLAAINKFYLEEEESGHLNDWQESANPVMTKAGKELQTQVENFAHITTIIFDESVSGKADPWFPATTPFSIRRIGKTSDLALTVDVVSIDRFDGYQACSTEADLRACLQDKSGILEAFLEKVAQPVPLPSVAEPQARGKQ